MRKLRTDISSQGFYDKIGVREFKPGDEITEEEVRNYGIPENLLELLTEEEIEEQILDGFQSQQPHLGKIEIPEKKEEPIKPVKKRGRPKGSKNKKKSK